MSKYPKFYIGQKVTPLKSTAVGGGLEKGQVVTVENIVQCTCGAWMVGVAERQGFCEVSDHKGHDFTHPGHICFHGDEKFFAPVIENFQAITFEKILEKELSSVN